MGYFESMIQNFEAHGAYVPKELREWAARDDFEAGGYATRAVQGNIPPEEVPGLITDVDLDFAADVSGLGYDHTIRVLTDAILDRIHEQGFRWTGSEWDQAFFVRFPATSNDLDADWKHAEDSGLLRFYFRNGDPAPEPETYTFDDFIVEDGEWVGKAIWTR